jgi:hypothetical protein
MVIHRRIKRLEKIKTENDRLKELVEINLRMEEERAKRNREQYYFPLSSISSICFLILFQF